MTDEIKAALGWVLTGFVALVLLFTLIFGVAVACSTNLAHNSKNNVTRVHNDERVQLYKFCNRHFYAGLPIPKVCFDVAKP